MSYEISKTAEIKQLDKEEKSTSNLTISQTSESDGDCHEKQIIETTKENEELAKMLYPDAILKYVDAAKEFNNIKKSQEAKLFFESTTYKK